METLKRDDCIVDEAQRFTDEQVKGHIVVLIVCIHLHWEMFESHNNSAQMLFIFLSHMHAYPNLPTRLIISVQALLQNLSVCFV